MKDQTCKETCNENCGLPHVLVVVPDEIYGKALANALNTRSMCTLHTSTVDGFLDLQCRVRVDIVALEVDAFEPISKDDLIRLRTHFGEGPGTHVVVMSDFAPEWYMEQLLQQGADRYINRSFSPEEMADALDAEVKRNCN